MRIFTKEELSGQWSNENWGFQITGDHSFIMLNQNKEQVGKGTFKIHENFLVFDYQLDTTRWQWTARIDELKKNTLTLTDLTNEVGKQESLRQTYHGIDLIKHFDFDHFENATIDSIKKQLEVDALPLNRIIDSNGNETEYYWYWNNHNRFSVVISKELSDMPILTLPTVPLLQYQPSS